MRGSKKQLRQSEVDLFWTHRAVIMSRVEAMDDWYAPCTEVRHGGKMRTNTLQRKTQRNFLDIPSAAYEAGYSTRHFRRIIEEDRIPVLQIGRKFFILSRDLEAWKSTKGEARFDQAIQQLDGWLKHSAKISTEPVYDFEDED